MAGPANVGNVPQLRTIMTSHTQYARSRRCTVQCSLLQQPSIYDSYDDCWFAEHWSISVFKMSRPTDFQNLWKHLQILKFKKSLRGGPFFIFSLQGGRLATFPPVSYATVSVS